MSISIISIIVLIVLAPVKILSVNCTDDPISCITSTNETCTLNGLTYDGGMRIRLQRGGLNNLICDGVQVLVNTTNDKSYFNIITKCTNGILMIVDGNKGLWFHQDGVLTDYLRVPFNKGVSAKYLFSHDTLIYMLQNDDTARIILHNMTTDAITVFSKECEDEFGFSHHDFTLFNNKVYFLASSKKYLNNTPMMIDVVGSFNLDTKEYKKELDFLDEFGSKFLLSLPADYRYFKSYSNVFCSGLTFVDLTHANSLRWNDGLWTISMPRLDLICLFESGFTNRRCFSKNLDASLVGANFSFQHDVYHSNGQILIHDNGNSITRGLVLKMSDGRLLPNLILEPQPPVFSNCCGSFRYFNGYYILSPGLNSLQSPNNSISIWDNLLDLCTQVIIPTGTYYRNEPLTSFQQSETCHKHHYQMGLVVGVVIMFIVSVSLW